MDQVDVLARTLGIIGTATGSLSLLWAVYTWHHERRTRLDVSIQEAGLISPFEQTKVVRVRVVNRSSFPVSVAAVALSSKGNELDLLMAMPPEGGDLPGEIPARGAGTTWIPRSRLEEFWRSAGRTRAKVAVSTGETFKSKWIDLSRPDD